MSRIYDTRKVNVIVTRLDNNNRRYLTDFADGTFIAVEYNSDAFTGVTGSKGERSYAQMADNSGKITVTLKQTSPDLNFIRGIVKDAPKINIQIVDGSADGTVQASGTGVLMNRVGFERGKEISTREVIFDVENLLINE